MIKTLLLATDLTNNSDRAMERALKLAREHGADLHVIHVVEAYKDKVLQVSVTQDIEDLIRTYLDDYTDAKHVKISVQVLTTGEPYAAIAEYAYTIKADLIITGLHGKTKFREFFAGTTIERLAKMSPQPILVVKDKPTGAYQSIVSAVDYAPASRNALRMAMALSPSGVFEAVHAFTATAAYPAMAYYEAADFDRTEKRQHQMMTAFINTEIDHFKKTHNGTSKRLSHKVAQGSPHSIVIKEVKQMKADLLTLGAHSACALMPMKIGGTADDFLFNPPCDVLLVKE